MNHKKIFKIYAEAFEGAFLLWLSVLAGLHTFKKKNYEKECDFKMQANKFYNTKYMRVSQDWLFLSSLCWFDPRESQVEMFTELSQEKKKKQQSCWLINSTSTVLCLQIYTSECLAPQDSHIPGELVQFFFRNGKQCRFLYLCQVASSPSLQSDYVCIDPRFSHPILKCYTISFHK